MVSLDDAVIAKLKKGSKEFKIYVDPDLSLSYKKKEINDISKIMASEYIFENSNGDKVQKSELKKYFNTEDVYKVAHQIIMNGTVQLTTNQKKKILENKKNSVITYIVENAINPKTMIPYTRQRIEIAMKESKINIDPSKSIEEIVINIMKSIQKLIPIRLEKINILCNIPSIYSSKVIGKIHPYCKVINKKWDDNGNLEMIIEIPSGMKNNFYNTINYLTNGNHNIKIISK